MDDDVGTVSVAAEVRLVALAAGPRLSFADVEVTVGGLPMVIHGVRIIAERDGRRRVAPPLHAAGKGRLVEGWTLPPEIAAAVAELLLEI